MRKLNFLVLAIIAINFLAAAQALGQTGSDEQQIKTLSDQLAQAYLKDDTSFFEKYFSDDYTGVYSSGTPYTKTESLAPGALKYESFDVREMKIRVYGNTAVVTSLTSATGTVRKDGKPFSGLYRTIRVWVKQKDGWKLIAFQSTQVPSASH
jgi:ketosteroid isomerase-like protein